MNDLPLTISLIFSITGHCYQHPTPCLSECTVLDCTYRRDMQNFSPSMSCLICFSIMPLSFEMKSREQEICHFLSILFDFMIQVKLVDESLWMGIREHWENQWSHRWCEVISKFPLHRQTSYCFRFVYFPVIGAVD
jgi:hypothetical protein